MTAPRDPIEWEDGLGVRPSSPAWRAAIKAIYGQSLTAAEHELFRQLSGGLAPPKGGAPEVLILAGRRGGKSESIARLGVFEAVHVPHAAALAPGQTAAIPIISPLRAQSQQILDYAKGLTALPQVRPFVAASLSDSVLFKTRVKMSVYTADEIAVVGVTAVGVVRDEWARFPVDGASPDAAIENNLRPTMAPIHGAPPRRFIGITSAFLKRGLAFETDRDNFGKKHADVLVLRGPTEVWNPNIDRRFLAREQKRMGAAAYAREYECCWMDEVAAAFEHDVVAACVDHGVRSRPPVSGTRYVVACDVGLRRDRTAVLVAHRELRERPGMPPNDCVVVDHLVVLKPGLLKRIELADVEREIAQACKRYGVREVLSDLHYADSLRPGLREIGIRHVECPMNPSAQEKRSSILASRLQGNGIALLDDPDLIAELRAAQTKVSANKIMISAPDKKGAHDDVLDALLLAVERAATLPPGGGPGAIFFEQDLTGHFNRELGTMSGFEKRWYRRNPDGSRTRCDAPPGTKEHERSREDRFAQGMHTPGDVAELGEDEVFRRLNRPVR